MSLHTLSPESRRQTTPELTLVLLHHAGGSSQSFGPLLPHLPATWQVLGVDLPGRLLDREDKGCRTVEEAVGRVHADLRLRLDGPFAVFGHSMGALIAYELVRRMETEHHGPVWFGASGMLAPDAGRPTSAHVLQHPSGTFIPPASVSAVLARRMLEILKADLRLVDNYQYAPGPLLRTALSVFGGTADSLAPAPQLDRWSEHAVHGAARHLWPGGHFFLFDHAASVSARLVGSCRAALAAKALALQI